MNLYHIVMKRFILIPFLAIGLILNSLAQKPTQKTNSPKEEVKVNREYDEKGNLIKFDSLHSYSWSSDTTLLKSFSPKDFSDQFGDQFNFFSDSTLQGKSFFDDFDNLLAQPYSKEQDSLLMKKFGLNPHFHNFRLNTDSLAMNLKDFNEFFNFPDNKNDSLSSRSPHKLPLYSQPKLMDEMMKMLQQQMEQMQEYQQKLFKEDPKTKVL